MKRRFGLSPILLRCPYRKSRGKSCQEMGRCCVHASGYGAVCMLMGQCCVHASGHGAVYMLMGRYCVHASEHGAVCMLMGRCCVHAGETHIDRGFVLRVRSAPTPWQLLDGFNPVSLQSTPITLLQLLGTFIYTLKTFKLPNMKIHYY